MTRRKSIRSKEITELLLITALLVVFNYLASRVFYRIDFTEEKRYTLSSASHKLASALDDVMYVKIFLDGDDLPPAYKNLRNATKEMIDEFRHVAYGNIEYEIYNPLEGLEGEELRNVILELRQSGLVVTDLYEKTNDGSRQKLLVTGAHVYYKGLQYPVHLIDPSIKVNSPATINQAIEGLEFTIANTIRRCVQTFPKKIAFMEGHGELENMQLADAKSLLDAYYSVERMNLNFEDSGFYTQILDKLQGVEEDSLAFAVDRLIKQQLNSFDAIIFAKPRIAFAEREKYWIDQYIMHGGKVLWMIDPLHIENDTLARYGKVFTVDYDLNLTDLLFKYGVRVNPDLVLDYNALIVPFGREGGGTDPKPWYYFPVIPSRNNHAINRNLDLVWLQYPSSIDTVGSPNLKKTVLLKSSNMSRVSNHPVEIDMQIVRRPPPEGFFKAVESSLAVLVEGPFESPYVNANRKELDPEGTFKSKVDNSRMIVIGDGDLMANLVRRDGQIYPAGFDRLTEKIFGNRQFFMNCVDYLVDDYGLIEVRNKTIQLRLLDKDKINKPSDQNKWKTLNMVLPIVLVMIFGLVNHFIRKKKYER